MKTPEEQIHDLQDRVKKLEEIVLELALLLDRGPEYVPPYQAPMYPSYPATNPLWIVTCDSTTK